MAKLSRTEQAEEIKRLAEESGVQSNYLFVTTFDRYQVQLSILDKLEQALNDINGETTVEKEYVKGRRNIVINPVFTEYNKTVDSTNKTVSTLMRIIKNFDVGAADTEEEDKLMAAIRGDDDGEGDK